MGNAFSCSIRRKVSGAECDPVTLIHIGKRCPTCGREPNDWSIRGKQFCLAGHQWHVCKQCVPPRVIFNDNPTNFSPAFCREHEIIQAKKCFMAIEDD